VYFRAVFATVFLLLSSLHRTSSWSLAITGSWHLAPDQSLRVMLVFIRWSLARLYYNTYDAVCDTEYRNDQVVMYLVDVELL